MRPRPSESNGSGPVPLPPVPTMHLLGRIGLHGADGRDLDLILRQPKRLALLAYLALPRPGTWHRRDVLLGVFWPEMTASRARTALRNALYVLRQNLADGAIRTRGDDEVSLDPAVVTTDVGRFADAIAEHRFEDALASYGGDLLPGLFIPTAEGFEKWLDSERSRLRSEARRCAYQVAAARESAGEYPRAAEAAERALDLDPDDESAVRHVIQLLDRAGDRSRALATFDRFRERFAREYGAEPSEETSQLVQSIRSRRTPVVAAGSAEGVGPVAADAGGDEAPALARTAPLSGSGAPARASSRLPRRFRLVAVAAFAVAALALFAANRNGAPVAPPLRAILIAPIENGTGDSSLAFLASGISEDLARRLRSLGSMAVKGAHAGWPAAARNDLVAAGRRAGVPQVLTARLVPEGDSLAVTASIVEVATGARREAGRVRFSRTDLPEAGSRLAALVAGSVFRVPLPAMPRGRPSSADPESYRLTIQGWYEQLNEGVPAAKRLFLQAIDRDPTNARAWAGLASAWSAQAVQGVVPFDEGAARAIAAAERAIALDSLEGSAWADLGIIKALSERRLAVGESLIRKAIRLDPANPELYLLLSALYRRAWQWENAIDAIRVAQALDPMSPTYAQREAILQLCAGRDSIALARFRVVVQMDPAWTVGRRGLVRALARTGHWDEALETWRSLEAPGTDLSDRLGRAKGEQGFRDVTRFHWQRRLAEPPTRGRAVPVDPADRGLAMIAAGDVEDGFDAVEAAYRSGSKMLSRAPCLEPLDWVRDHPRYRRLLARAEKDLLR
ncbi:MAG: hypothetical protein JNJ80_26500 [Gemmatimonadetes bacterium]|nr:hypothetical protein [Gemmatimonadota bacterium]